MEYRSFDDPVSDGSKITFGSSEQRIADITAKRAQRKVAIILISVSSGILALFIIGGLVYWQKRIRYVENASGKRPKEKKDSDAAEENTNSKKKKEKKSKGNKVKATAMLEKEEDKETAEQVKREDIGMTKDSVPIKKEEVERKSVLKVTPVVEPGEVKVIPVSNAFPETKAKSNNNLKITEPETSEKSNRNSKVPSESKLISNNDVVRKSTTGLMVEPEVYGKSSRNSKAPSESKLKSTADVRQSSHALAVEQNRASKATSSNDIRNSNAPLYNDVGKSVAVMKSDIDIVNVQISGIESDPSSKSPSNNDITKSRIDFDFEDTKILEVEKKEHFDKSSSSDEN